jgi:hypothetical protein
MEKVNPPPLKFFFSNIWKKYTNIQKCQLVRIFLSKVKNLKLKFFLEKVKAIQKSTNIEIFLKFFMEKVNQYRNRNLSF